MQELKNIFKEESNKIASENKILSDNTIKNSLINFEVDFNGLGNVIASFFPSMRNEMILRYRAETIARIGIEAYNLAKERGKKINPIPPKIALPLIEIMSLEHETEMYEKWAKLLVAAGENPNPKHQQYADILANLNNYYANILKKIYEQQDQPDAETKFDEYVDKLRFQESFDIVKNNIYKQLPEVYTGGINAYFRFPYYILGTKESKQPQNQFLVDSNNIYHEENTHFMFSEEEYDMITGLEKLGLIKYQVLQREYTNNEDGRLTFREKCGIFLTKYGYSFVDCLEKATE